MGLFSKSKKIICSGDSYTDNYRAGNVGTKPPYQVWPNFLGNKFEKDNYFIPSRDLINVGSSGAGNYEIYSRTLDTICNNENIGLVIVMWSEFPRTDFEIDLRKIKRKDMKGHLSEARLYKGNSNWPVYYENMNPQRVLYDKRKGLIKITADGKKVETEDWKYKLSYIFDYKNIQQNYSGINAFMRYTYSIQSICELQNIPLIQIMGPEPVMNDGVYYPEGENISGHRRFHKNWHQACLMFLEHSMLNKIKNNFVGWPIFKEIGGFCVDDLIRENDSKWNGKRGSNWPSDFRISEEDSHPNTKGHKFIGEYLYEQCKHLYPDS